MFQTTKSREKSVQQCGGHFYCCLECHTDFNQGRAELILLV